MANYVAIRNVGQAPLRIGTTTIASLASATVDTDDEKTARDLDSFSGRYAVNDAAAQNGILVSPAFSGVPTAPTAAVNTNTTQIATTAFVLGQASGNNPLMDGTVSIGVSLRYSRDDHVHPSDTSRAPINNPVFTGDPQAPTPLTADNDTSIATTAFVKAQGYTDIATVAATYAPINNPTLTGDPKAPTPLTADNDTSIATTAFVKAQSYLDTTTAASTYAPLASPTFTGDPKGPTPAPGDNDTSLATTAFIQAALGAAIPTGVIWQYGAASAPTGWLLCNGDPVDRTTYAALFAIISTTYGVGDGSTTFNLPDFRGRMAMGSGTGTAADATAHALGSTGAGGFETHTLTTAQLPAHDHGSTPLNGLTGSTTPGVTGGPSTNTTDSQSVSTSSGPSTNTSDGPSPDATNSGGVILPNAGTAGTVLNPGTVLIGSQWGSSISAGVTGHSNGDAKTNHSHTLSNHTHTLGNHTHTYAHTHTLGSHTHTSAAHTHALATVGSGASHNNLPPFTTVNYIIKI